MPQSKPVSPSFKVKTIKVSILDHKLNETSLIVEVISNLKLIFKPLPNNSTETERTEARTEGSSNRKQ